MPSRALLTCAATQSVIQHVAWNPNPAMHIVAVALKTRVVLLSTGTACGLELQSTFDVLSGARQEAADRVEVAAGDEGSDNDDDSDGAGNSAVPSASKKDPVWSDTDVTTAAALEGNTGAMVEIHHPGPIKRIHWHRKGMYLATVGPSATSRSVCIHHVARRKSQFPFKRNIGLVQCVAFHPTKPLFYCANQVRQSAAT